VGFCEKCGSYIPIDETACPACGHDPGATYKPPEYRPPEYEPAQQQSPPPRETKNPYSSTYRQSYGSAAARQEREKEPWNRAPDRDPWDSRAQTGAGGAQERQSYTASSAQSPSSGSVYGSAAQNTHRAPYTVPGDISDNRYLCILCYLGPLFLIPFLLRRHSPFVRFHCNQGLVLLLAWWLLDFCAGFVFLLGWMIQLIGGILYLIAMFRGISSAVRGRMDKLPLIGDLTILR